MNGPSMVSHAPPRPSIERPIGKTQHDADNSAKSADSRVWRYVSRDLLIGKAFFIYWPHSWSRIPYLKIPFPYFPNFSRMGFVR